MEDGHFNLAFEESVPQGGGTSDFNELINRPKYNGALMNGNTNIPAVPTKTSDLINDSDFVDQQALDTLEQELQSEIAEKQDTLTAGEGISLAGNEIGVDFDTVANKDYVDNHHDDTKQDTLIAGENITIVDNVISATGGAHSENAYESIEELGNVDDTFFFDTTYTELDYGAAKEYFDNLAAPDTFACSAIVKDGVLGRTFDWHYDNRATFRVTTPHTGHRYATNGVAALSGIEKDFVKSGEYSELFKYMPFSMLDGQNEKGLQAAILVVPADKGETLGTPVTATAQDRVVINALMLIRYALDHFANIQEVIGATQSYLSIYVPQALRNLGYECHFIFKDNESVYALEFDYNTCVWTDITNKPIMTNFFLFCTTFKADGSVYVINEEGISTSGLTARAQGLERYNLLLQGLNDTTADIKDVLDSVKYTQLYTKDWSEGWLSEYCGTNGLTIYDDRLAFYNTYLDGQTAYTARSRTNPITDQTVHMAIYGDYLDVYTQERLLASQRFRFPIVRESMPDVYRIECAGYINVDGHILPDITPAQFDKAVADGAIANDRIICVSNITAGEFYSANMSVTEGTDVVITFVYEHIGLFQYTNEIKDVVTTRFIPFERPNIVGYYDEDNDKFYTTLALETEIEPKHNTLFVDITDANTPMLYLCLVSGSIYGYKLISGGSTGGVVDVKVNGTSVVISGVADIDLSDYAVRADVAVKQNITDNTLATNAKQVVPAINEVNSIAKGANQAISYESYARMVEAINPASATAFNVGQNIMIVTVDVPDLWIYKVETDSYHYEYTTDQAIIDALAEDGFIRVGYYKISALETQKVDLTDYTTKTYVDTAIEAVEGEIPELLTTTGQSEVAGMTQKAITDALASAGGGGVKVLTTDDYDFPDADPSGVAIWKLEEGAYYRPKAVKAWHSSTLQSTQDEESFYVVSQPSSSSNANITIVSAGVTAMLGKYPYLKNLTINKTNGVINTENVALVTENLKNNLTSATAGVGALDAYQGKVLKDMIDNLPTGGAKVLTTDDFNWPLDNPTGIALWLLPNGVYSWDYSVSDSNLWICTGINLSGYMPSMVIKSPNHRWASDEVVNLFIFGSDNTSKNPLGAPVDASLFGFSVRQATGMYNNVIRITPDIVDNLNSYYPSSALSANQGRVLKDLIDSLIIKGTGAPTTSTVGTVGQLYEDTTNGKLYQCTAVSGSTYTWEEVGGGGSGVQYSDLFADGSSQTQVRMGASSAVSGTAGVAIGSGAVAAKESVSIGRDANKDQRGADSVALGAYAKAYAAYSVAVGRSSKATAIGEFSIGDSTRTDLYGGTGYRLLTNVYDPQSDHDAATKGYVDSQARYLHNIAIDTTTAVGIWRYQFQFMNDVPTSYTQLAQIGHNLYTNHPDIKIPASGIATQNNELYYVTGLIVEADNMVSVELYKASDGTRTTISSGAIDVTDVVM